MDLGSTATRLASGSPDLAFFLLADIIFSVNLKSKIFNFQIKKST